MTGLSQVVPLDFSINPAYFLNGLLGYFSLRADFLNN